MAAILMTGASAAMKIIGEMSPEPATSRLGATAPGNQVLLLQFEGVPINRIQERTVVVREVAITLPDLWEMVQTLQGVLDAAEAAGSLQVP